MGWLLSVLGLAGGAAASAVLAAAAAVAGIVSTVSSILSGISVMITTSIALTGAIVGQIIAGVASMLPVKLVSIESRLALKEAFISGNIFATVKAVGVMFAEFLTAIHFQTILKIHNIAFLVSSEYREMMRKVWGQIAEFAEAVELPAGYIEAAINTARTVVLDVSGFLGRPYDLGEITWLSEFQVLLKRMQSKAEQYRKNPQIIWEDLNELVIKPTIDNKARTQQHILSTIENVIDFGEKTVEDIEALRSKLRDGLDKLPFQWAKDIVLKTDDIWFRFESWKSEVYLPIIGNMGEIIDELHVRQTNNKDKLNEMFADLRYPGDYLGTVDDLPDQQRLIQEEKIAEVSRRASDREVTDWTKHTESKTLTLESVLRAIEFMPPPSKLPYVKLDMITVRPGGQIADHSTWFVGDY